MRDVKYALLRSWPLRWPRARTVDDVRLIFSGLELQDEECVCHIRDRAKTDPVAIHLTVRERAPSR